MSEMIASTIESFPKQGGHGSNPSSSNGSKAVDGLACKTAISASQPAGRSTDLPATSTDETTSQPQLTVRSLFTSNRWPILATYALFNIENLLRLAQPFVLGLAINGLLKSNYFGLWLFVAQHLAHLAISSFRQMYDTRTFTGIYTRLATQLVVDQRARGIDVSRVSARSVLSREYVEFFERYMPMLIRALYSIVGALVMLAIYDWMLVSVCLALLGPAIIINRFYARQTLRLSRHLHDELEREVDVITPGDADEVHNHYSSVAAWRIKHSDCEAVNFGIMELFVLGVLVLSLLQVCTAPTTQAGDIFAVFRYVLMLIMGLDSVPKLVHQVSRLRDIGTRVGGNRNPRRG